MFSRSSSKKSPGWVRFAMFVLWPLAFIFVCVDLNALDADDAVFLPLLAALGIWATLTNSIWARRVAIGISFAVIFFGVGTYGPSARAAISRNPTAGPEFSAGVMALYNIILPQRPYVLVAAIALAAMCLNGPKRNQ